MKPKLRVAMPPTDAELADAERRQLALDTAHIEQAEDEREQRTLAKAGDPDAQAALAATASMIQSRPVEHEDDETQEPSTPKRPRRSKTDRRTAGNAKREGVARETAPSDNGTPKERDLPTDAGQAYKLMDLAFRKWKKMSQRDLRGANRELARDLGGDAAIYLQSGVVRLSDMLDAMNKLTALAKPKEDEPEGGDIESEMESMRAALRGGV